MPVDIIQTRGNHYEVGVQQARIYRSLVGNINVMKVLQGMEMVKAATPIGGAPFNFVFSQILKSGGRKMLKSIYSILPNQYDKLEGIAEGFGVSTEKIAQVYYFENFSGDMKLDTGVSKTACSAGIISKEDQGFMIKNFDFPNEVEEFQTMRYIHLKAKEGYSTVGLAEGPFPGMYTGMNEKGMTMTWNSAYTNDLDLGSVPVSLFTQECLEIYDTMEDTVEFFKESPIPIGCLVFVVDKDHKGAVIERTAHETAVRYMESAEYGEYIAASNSYLDPKTREKQLPDNTIWTVKGVKGLELIKGSDIRSNRINQLLLEMADKPEKIKLEDLLAILADHDGQSEGGENTICRHGLYWKTLSSMILEPKTRSVYCKVGNPCSDSELKKYEMNFDYEMPNIRFLRRYNPYFQFFDPLS